MISLEPQSQGRPEPESTATGEMLVASRRHHLRARRAHYARENGMVREAHNRYHFSPSDTTAITTAAAQLCDLLKSGRVSREHVESEQMADKHRLAGAEAVAGTNPEEQERLDNVRYRMAVRDKALDDYASYELSMLNASYGRSGHEVKATPPRVPWTKEANSAGSYAHLLRRPKK
jgi:hypothetical protein